MNRSSREGTNLKKACAIFTAAILAAAMLTGCGTGKPVSNDATNPPKTAAPTRTPPVSEPAATTPTATPGRTYEQPSPYVWPMDASDLFAPGTAPEDFSCPLYLSGDALMFLYATAEGNVRRAVWKGDGYGTEPVAENINARPASAFFVDATGQRLFCAGSRQYGKDATGPAIVMVSLADGSRCNLDEASQWKEEGCTVSSDFQYCGGRVLARLVDLQGKALDRWALFDVAKKTYAVLDMTNFLKDNMPGWKDPVSLRLALAGGDKLLAFCAAGGHVAESRATESASSVNTASPSPEATGTAPPESKPYECHVFTLGLNGKAIAEGVLVAGSEQPECCRVQGGSFFNVSPDGKCLLYGGQDGGLYLYDIEKNAEYTVLAGGSGYVFAEWGRDGSIYYCAATQAPGRVAKLYKASVAGIESLK